VSVLIVQANALALPLADCSVQCVLTSPPYWGAQRDYGMAGQLGMERQPSEYVAALVAVFRGVRRVLRDDGVLWLQIGDSYAASGKGGGGRLMAKRGESWKHRKHLTGWRSAPPGFKNKDLVGIPWMVAVALRDDGWYLRRDVVWSKGAATEPTRADRPCGSHEMLFLLSKREDYRFDPSQLPHGSVWGVHPVGTFGDHCATFPPGIAEPCIGAGSKRGDVVLDPFSGAGTCGIVADGMGRHYIGVELNPAFATASMNRLMDRAPLFAADTRAAS
jgi:site-specific DNA-methyltransferase (adenine-specific)